MHIKIHKCIVIDKAYIIYTHIFINTHTHTYTYTHTEHPHITDGKQYDGSARAKHH